MHWSRYNSVPSQILCSIRINHPDPYTDLANAPSTDCADNFKDGMAYGTGVCAKCNSIFKDDAGFVVDDCLSVGVHMSTIVVVCNMLFLVANLHLTFSRQVTSVCTPTS